MSSKIDTSQFKVKYRNAALEKRNIPKIINIYGLKSMIKVNWFAFIHKVILGVIVTSHVYMLVSTNTVL